jgi:hypothetical protein
MNVQFALTAFRSAVVSLIGYVPRLLMVGVLILIMLVGLIIVSSISGFVHERIPTISPNVLAVAVPLTGVSIFFGAFYLNIRRAKKRVSCWRPGSSYLFFRSNGLLGVKVRARRVWMKELGYEEREALIIAGCQERAIVMTGVGVIALVTVVANLAGP